MNRLIILSIIMTTFFMEGCINNQEKTITYFDQIYIPVQQIVELDNVFQEKMHQQLIATTEISKESDTLLDEELYDQSIEEIKTAHKDLINYINTELEKIKRISIYNNETDLQRAGIELMQTYSETANTSFLEMIQIIQKDYLTDADNDRFNYLLKKTNETLNTELERFYEIAQSFGDRNEIDLEFDEEEL